MSLGKRLFIGEAAADDACTTDTVDIFGDSNGFALYSLDYDASDASGNHNGTVSGGVTFGVDGQINWGASFDGGSSTQIEIPDNDVFSPVTNDFSASMWVKPTSGHVMSKQGEWHIRTYGGGADGFVEFWLFRSGGGSTHSRVLVAYNTGITDGDWHHLVVTADYLSSYKIYLDGVKIGENTSGFSGTMLNTSNPVRIGSNGTATTERYLGDLDQVRFFKKSLSQSDVDTLYAETACVYTSTTDTIHYQGTNAAYYKLDNNALDETSNNHDGAESNITYEFGRFGTAAVFNGSSSDIEISKSVFGTGDGTADVFTISLWFNTATNNGVLAGTRGNSSSHGFILWLLSDGTIRYDESNATGSIDTLITTNTYDDGNWHNVVVTRNASNQATLYVDGSVQVSTTTITTALTSHTNNLFIGRYTGGSLHYDGLLDQVRIYNSALDATAVQNLYNEKQAYITKNASDPFGDNSEEAFYKLENNVNDSTGSNNGAANNVTFTGGSGLFETYAAGFSGTNYITVTGLTSTSTFSYSLWVKPTNASSSGFKGIFGKQNSEGQLFTDSGALKIWTTTTQTFTGSPTLSDNVWSHIVLSVSNGTGTIYINGINKGTATGISLPSTLYMGTASTQIGNSTYSYQGLIDQVRILDRALDGDEVFKLYAEVIN